jgi:hypothetical protein
MARAGKTGAASRSRRKNGSGKPPAHENGSGKPLPVGFPARGYPAGDRVRCTPIIEARLAAMATSRDYQLKPAPPITLFSPPLMAPPIDTLARLPMTRW